MMFRLSLMHEKGSGPQAQAAESGGGSAAEAAGE
jgi:hypothetical protein